MENTNYGVIGELLMIKITAVPIQKEKDYDALKKAVPAHLMDDKVIECLKKYIGTKCDTMRSSTAARWLTMPRTPSRP